MFGFFKRKKIDPWEIDLLLNVLKSIHGDFYRVLESQVLQNLHRGVLIGLSDIPGYVGFTFNSDVYKSFYDKNGRNIRLENIYVFDQYSKQYVRYNIYISSGVINGYRITESKYKIDVNKIDISKFRKVYLDNKDSNFISELLTAEEKELINSNDVFLVKIEGHNYFHLKDIGDGDFIGIDVDKNVYKITQDPPEITLIKKDLLKALSKVD